MPDITTKLAGWWKFADAGLSQFDDSAPVVPQHPIPVTSNVAGFPKLTNREGICREFANIVSFPPDNFGRLALSTIDFNAMVGDTNGNQGDFTVAFWMRSHVLVGGESVGAARILEIGGYALTSDTEQNKQYAIRVQRAKTAPLKYTIGWKTPPNVSTSFTPAYVSTDEVWEHVAFVVRQNLVGVTVFIDLYINGVLQETSVSKAISFAASGLPPATPFLRVSTANTQSDVPDFGQVTGYLRDLRLYARALVAGDVAALVTANPPGDVKISVAVLDGAAQKTGLTITAANLKTGLAATTANSKTGLTADAAKAKSSAVLP